MVKCKKLFRHMIQANSRSCLSLVTWLPANWLCCVLLLPPLGYSVSVIQLMSENRGRVHPACKLSRMPIHSRSHTLTCSFIDERQIKKGNQPNLHVFGRKAKYPEEIHQAQEDHVNSMHTDSRRKAIPEPGGANFYYQHEQNFAFLFWKDISTWDSPLCMS